MRTTTRILIVILLVHPFLVIADQPQGGFEVTCKNNELLVTGYHWMNNEGGRQKLEGSTLFRDFEHQTVNCRIANYLVTVELYQQYRGFSVRCGAGERVTIKVNNQVILFKEPMDDCGNTFTSITVNSSDVPGGGYELKLCGHSTDGVLPKFDGCVMVHSSQLDSYRRPLGPEWPPSLLLGIFTGKTPVIERAALDELFRRDGLEVISRIDAQIAPECSARKLISVQTHRSPHAVHGVLSKLIDVD